MLGKSPFDNAGGICNHLLPVADGVFDIGSSTLRIRNLYLTGSVFATPDLPNNTYLNSLPPSGATLLPLLKANASSATVLNTKTATAGILAVNGVSIGTWSSTAFTYPAFNLSDGSDKNHSISTYASGTGYTLTNTSAAVVMGTSSASLVLDKAGTYLVTSRVNLEYVGATFAANRTVTLKLRRTNNTPADVTGSSTALGTNIVTTVNGVMAATALPFVIYTTANTNDIIVPFADVSVAPTAGSLQATEACIVAFRLY